METISKISWGTLGLTVGGILTILGVTAYITDNAVLNLAGFFYGIPLVLLGLALKIAELKPVPFSRPTSEEILALRKRQATPIQNQVRQDVTRYRYGQSAHLDESLKRLGLSPSEKERPVLKGVRETAIEGTYALVLEFESSLIPLVTWQQKQEKIEKFFGPGVQAELTQPQQDRIDLILTAMPKATEIASASP